MPRQTLFLVLSAALLCITACSEPAATGTAVPTVAVREEATVVLPTTIPPEQMPTARPLWTETPLPQPTEPPAETEAPTRTAAADATAQPQVAASPTLDTSLVAVVNGQAITRAAYEQQVQQAEMYMLQQPGFDLTAPNASAEVNRVKVQVLERMIDQVLIEQAAEESGVTVSASQIAAQLAMMQGDDATRFAQWLESNGMTLEELQEQIRVDLMTAAVRDSVTKSLSRVVEQVHVRHILLSEETAAKNALARLRGGDNFIAVAREVSADDATRESGGDLGFLPRGVLPPEVEAAAFVLQPGETSDVVVSSSGYHIIQLVEVDPGRKVPDDLWPIVQARAFDDWLDAQRARSTIRRGVLSLS